MDEEMTSGTSDFEESTINEPDDCYCESFDIERLSSDILLRPADKYYLDNIIEWKMQTILEGYPNEQPPPEEYNKISNYVKNKTPKMLDDTRIIMYNNDQPIGMIIAYQKEQDWFIDDIFLIPEFRHKGIGRMILENEIASHDQLALWVYKSNIHAISLYESLGFKVEESIKERQMMRLRKTDVELIKGWRVTYQGIGIYEALKNAMFEQTGSSNAWISFINSDACNWLPKPPSYGNDNKSFFTEKGFNRFDELVLPIIAQYIDQTKIYIEEIMVPANQIVYSDEFQFVISDTMQESAYYQEASNKTKVTREKNKIKNDLNVDKNGFGKIIDRETNKEIPVKLSFDYNEPTHVSRRKYDSNKQMYYIPMNINPNDLDRGHGFTKYLHEKNHIIQDVHKMKEILYEDNKQVYKFKYTRDNDISDEKLVKAFIDKHRNELLGPHSKDPEEYLADLHTARKSGFNETIRMLEDMIYYENKNKNKSIKNNLAIIKREAVEISEKDHGNNNDRIKNLLKLCKEMLNEHKSKLKYYNTMSIDANNSDIKYEKSLIKILEKVTASFGDFKKYVINHDSLKKYEELINEYNNDLKMRILFLRDMKKIDDRNSHISEGFIEYHNKYDDPLDELLNIYNYKTYVESYNVLQSLYQDIKYQLNNFIQEYGISDNTIDDIANHFILEYLENEGDE